MQPNARDARGPSYHVQSEHIEANHGLAMPRGRRKVCKVPA